MRKPARSIVVAFSGLSAVGLLTACAAGTEPGAGASTPAPGGAGSSAGTGASYADGTYTADGQYVAPSGPESVTVTVTIADETITAVEVEGHASDRQAQQHQADFAGGIAGVVVGKPIDGLAVDRVAGSSLTGIGFNAALEQIRAQAAA